MVDLMAVYLSSSTINLFNQFKSVICKERFLIFCLNDIAFVNMYLPCKSSMKTDEYVNLLVDTLEQISGHLTSVSPKFIIAGGDF